MKINKTAANTILSSENASIDVAMITCMDQIQGMQTAIPCGQMSSPLTLSGQAFQALADRTQNLRLPAAQGHLAALDAIREANVQNMAAIAALPETSAGILDTDLCAELIADLQMQNNNLRDQEQWYSTRMIGEDSWMYASVFSNICSMISKNDDMIQELQDKITAAEEYDRASSSFYSDATGKASDILEKSTNSIKGFLANGSYGDISWRSDIDDAYKNASDKLRDRILLELSNTGDGIAIISDDLKYIYYKGVKWAIARPGDLDTIGPGPVFNNPFKDIDIIYLEGDLLFSWARFLSSQAPVDSILDPTEGSPISTAGKGAQEEKNYEALSIFENSVFNALDKAHIHLVFSSNGIDNRVTILGGMSHETLISYDEYNHSNTGNTRICLSTAYDYCDSYYFKNTGQHLDPEKKYKVIYMPDPERSKFHKGGNTYELLYYDDKGTLMSMPKPWPNDRLDIEINKPYLFTPDVVLSCNDTRPKKPFPAGEDYETVLALLGKK